MCALALAVQDNDPRCQDVLCRQAQSDFDFGRHVFVDLVEIADIIDLIHRTAVPQGPVIARCCCHGSWCELQHCDLDVTGTPCQDFAPNGNRQGRHGPQWRVFMAWVTMILGMALPIVLHENVPQFPPALLHEFLGHIYIIYTMVVDCEHIGFRVISRKRRYSILYHRHKVTVTANPVDVYWHLARTLRPAIETTAFAIPDCFLADSMEIESEIRDLCAARRVVLAAAMQNMALLLTGPELLRLAEYLKLWEARFNIPASLCRDAVFNLGDNPTAGYVTWSASSGRLPGLRTHGAKYWVPYLERWLTTKELLACMGLPVYPQLAAAAGVPLVTVIPGPAARHMLGNMMHVASVGSVIAVALASCRLSRPR